MTMKTDVVVVGAGPTGLMAANQLMRFGIDFIIVDTKDGPTDQSRAIVLTPRSMEIYHQLGLSDDVKANSADILSVNAYTGGKRKARIEIGEIGKGLSEFPCLIGYEQSKNETLLYRNLTDHGHDVRWHTEFEAFAVTEDGVEAHVEHEGESYTIACRYLIGCGGARSPVRHQLGFSFPGGTYDNRFFVADTMLKWALDYEQLIVSPGDATFCGFFPLEGDRRYRVIGTLPAGDVDREDIAFSDVEALVIENLGLPVTFEAVNWFATYKLHHRMTDRFRDGPIFIAGDAAHIHSPAGGQGMNTGLQDAYNLVWKLAFVLKGHGREELLDTYDEERLPFAKWLLKFTDRGFSVMTSTN
jgi:2-polyprenyl-6-methoxyphenol hydroxylase-like FAD-dependent oxidoreductase